MIRGCYTIGGSLIGEDTGNPVIEEIIKALSGKGFTLEVCEFLLGETMDELRSRAVI